MSERYFIRHMPDRFGALKLQGAFAPERLSAPWSELEEIRLDRFPGDWDPVPGCAARLGWNQAGIHVLIYAPGPAARAGELAVRGEHCGGIRLEFLLGFGEDPEGCVVFESDSLGGLRIGMEEAGGKRAVFEQAPVEFAATHAACDGCGWAVSYTIPAAFLEERLAVQLRRGVPVRGGFACRGMEGEGAHPTDTPETLRPERFMDMRLGGIVPETIRDIEPFHLFGNIYFVGTTAVSVHLIDTGDGLIMIDTGYPFMRDAIVENMRRIGFDLSQVRIILLSHGHHDHYGNAAYFKERSGARVYISRQDNEIINGHLNLSWTDEAGFERIPPIEADVRLEDGAVVSLGNTQIHCRLAPGHTAGTMCFFFDVQDRGRTLRAAMHGGIGMNSMKRDFLDRYGMGDDLRRRFRADVERLKELPVDIVLGNHPGQNHTVEKLARLRAGDAEAFIDPSEWRSLMERCAMQVDQIVAEEARASR